MKLLYTVDEMRSAARQARTDHRKIGFVPTMGFLHEGHLSLVRKARTLADFVVVSIFVNPTQFGPGEDFDRYPRDLQRDAALCRGENVDILFCPSPSEMYQNGYSVYVEETELSSGLCGAFRPGHFRGVTTVVTKLFNIVQPDIAVFGQKDAQQARIILQLVRDLNIPVEIIIAPTVRDPDGLAMSSRNVYLSSEERKVALRIYRALCSAQRLFEQGMRQTTTLLEAVRGELLGHSDSQSQPALPAPQVDYIAAVDWLYFKHVETICGKTLIAVAVRIGKTRLIDNIILGE